MSIDETIEHMEIEDVNDRPLWPAIFRGLACKCPACGEGNLFTGFLTSNDSCSKCDLDLSHQRADDLPAYLNIFIVGHVVLTLMMVVMKYDLMGMWSLMALTITVAIVCAIACMRPLRGGVIASQWALRMHGF